MQSSALLAIDLGTSAIKVVAFDFSGQLLSRRRGETPTTLLADGRAEHDVDALWSVVADLIATVVADLPAYRIEAVGVASVGEAGVPLDSAGRPVRPAIAWFDSRGGPEAAWWTREAGSAAVGRITGQAIDAHYGVNRLMWMREHEPHAFGRVRHWLSLADFVIHRLCGVYATDFTLASRTMVFDQGHLDWSDELLGLAGLDRSLLPEVHPSGVCVGTVGKEAAEITHLRWGTLVVTGGHDRLCAAYAARGKEPLLVDSTGSAEAVVLPIERYAAPNPAVSGFVACYADVVPGQYVLSARVGYAGALVDWYWREVRARGVGANHPTVDAEIDWPLSFSGLLCYPSFGRVLAPTWDSATASGAILGLTLGHRQSHLLQALIEGVGYSLRANVEWLERCVGRAIPTIRVEGALTGSRVWMQLKADVTGRRVEGLRLEEATALGAALLAGVGAGIYPDCDAATAVVARDLETWMPTAELAATYSDVFEHGFQRLPRLISEIAVALEQAAGHRDRDSGA